MVGSLGNYRPEVWRVTRVRGEAGQFERGVFSAPPCASRVGSPWKARDLETKLVVRRLSEEGGYPLGSPPRIAVSGLRGYR
jgi:hypothetical protein